MLLAGLILTSLNTLSIIYLVYAVLQASKPPKVSQHSDPPLGKDRKRLYITDPDQIKSVLRALSNDDAVASKKEKKILN